MKSPIALLALVAAAASVVACGSAPDPQEAAAESTQTVTASCGECERAFYSRADRVWDCAPKPAGTACSVGICDGVGSCNAPAAPPSYWTWSVTDLGINQLYIDSYQLLRGVDGDNLLNIPLTSFWSPRQAQYSTSQPSIVAFLWKLEGANPYPGSRLRYFLLDQVATGQTFFAVDLTNFSNAGTLGAAYAVIDQYASNAVVLPGAFHVSQIHERCDTQVCTPMTAAPGLIAVFDPRCSNGGCM